MNHAFQTGLGVALFVALPFGLSWVFAYTYTFFQPLHLPIDSARVEEFRLAGGAAGLIVAVILVWWMTH